MGEQNDRANRSSKQPATSDPIAWRAYWQTQNQARRTEPEISLERQEALVLSVSSFHGRGFFSQEISLGDTYARLAAVEAVIGLMIEISLIATFTQRFFGK